jgi:serine/threonine protein kinase
MIDDELVALVLRVTGASAIAKTSRIQTLWEGYGEILRIELLGDVLSNSVILKRVSPPSLARDASVSHARKLRSYEVERAFYGGFASRCDDTCRVPRLLCAWTGRGEHALVLEDLDAAGFSTRRRDPRGEALTACLRWLASFHARFMSTTPERLWRVGTYWHLDTRRDELSNIDDARVRDAAPELDRALREAHHQTLVHGDAKPANFCFTQDGRRVAAVDFQYVGGGPGIRDVAYLLHGSSRADESRALDLYFSELRPALTNDSKSADEIEQEWRTLYPTASADFERFLRGWRR